jgi:hypothetical protein
LAGGRTASDNWGKVAAILIVGYLCASRSFAYLGLPWIRLYIGEMILAAFLLYGPKTKQGRWLGVVRHTPELGRFNWLLLLLFCYGAFEALRGILSGYPAFAAARDTAFNYYPLFLFLGIWAGLRDRGFLVRVLRALAWWNGCYGLAYLVFLNRLSWTMPGTSRAWYAVSLFGQPSGSAVALLGLIAFEPRLGRIWHLIGLNLIVMLGMQVRAEWVGFLMGLIVYALCTKRVRRLAIMGAFLVALIGFMYLVKIDLPPPKGRGSRISAPSLLARAAAPFSPSFAAHLAPSMADPGSSGTVAWRLVWWISIWKAIHANASRALFGFGYGYPIGSLNPYIAPGTLIQTPHNDFFYALGFSGWIGVMLSALLQIGLARLLWGGYKVTGQPFGLMCWTALLAASMFEEFLETPFGAIPFYLLAGAALAPGLLCTRVAPAVEEALPIPPSARTAVP